MTSPHSAVHNQQPASQTGTLMQLPDMTVGLHDEHSTSPNLHPLLQIKAQSDADHMPMVCTCEHTQTTLPI